MSDIGSVEHLITFFLLVGERPSEIYKFLIWSTYIAMLGNRIHSFVCKVIYLRICVVSGDVVDDAGDTLTNVFVCLFDGI